MRILCISNLYPPHVIGGYEALCLEVAEGLKRRGHDVRVLTSTHGVSGEVTEHNAHRVLAMEGDLQFYRVADAWSYPRRKRRNLDHLRRLIAVERPNIVFVWGMWNLSKSLAQEDAPVISEGIELDPYLAHAARRRHDTGTDSLSLLYVGMLAAHKGVHTAIEALSHLPARDLERVHLTILGQGHQQYEQRLAHMVTERGLGHVVSFRSPIPRSELPDYLASFQVLVLPSIRSEPLSRVMQEGLASGMVVIGSATGGTAETITRGANGLLFPAGDAAALAAQVQRVLENVCERKALADAGVRPAVARFDITTMVDEVEAYLERVDATAARP